MHRFMIALLTVLLCAVPAFAQDPPLLYGDGDIKLTFGATARHDEADGHWQWGAQFAIQPYLTDIQQYGAGISLFRVGSLGGVAVGPVAEWAVYRNENAGFMLFINGLAQYAVGSAGDLATGVAATGFGLEKQIHRGAIRFAINVSEPVDPASNVGNDTLSRRSFTIGGAWGSDPAAP